MDMDMLNAMRRAIIEEIKKVEFNNWLGIGILGTVGTCAGLGLCLGFDYYAKKLKSSMDLLSV
jgi:hypothetical protein